MPGFVQYVSATQGPFLGNGAPQGTDFQVSAQGSTIIVGLTRLGDVGGANGSGDLAVFNFNLASPGSGNITFSDQQARKPQLRVKNLIWEGGSIQVQ